MALPYEYDPEDPTLDMSGFPLVFGDARLYPVHDKVRVPGKFLAQLQRAGLIGMNYANAARVAAGYSGLSNGVLNGMQSEPFAVGLPGISEHRLTLTSGTSVTTSDVTSATAIILEPHAGRGISLNDGFAWKRFEFDRQTIQLGTRTSGRPCDVFAKVSNGRFDYRLVEWSSGTARATAITRKDGVYVMSGDFRWKYLGTFYTTSTTATEDSNAKRYLWNAYNRAHRPLQRFETTSTPWTMNSSSFTQANGAVANQVDIVTGLAESTLDLFLIAAATHSTGGSLVSALCEDWSSGSPSSDVAYNFHNIAAANAVCPSVARLFKIAPLGKHSYVWIERNTSGATGKFYGATTDVYRCGIDGGIWS